MKEPRGRLAVRLVSSGAVALFLCLGLLCPGGQGLHWLHQPHSRTHLTTAQRGDVGSEVCLLEERGTEAFPELSVRPPEQYGHRWGQWSRQAGDGDLSGDQYSASRRTTVENQAGSLSLRST